MPTFNWQKKGVKPQQLGAFDFIEEMNHYIIVIKIDIRCMQGFTHCWGKESLCNQKDIRKGNRMFRRGGIILESLTCMLLKGTTVNTYLREK
jgi:hypothetical protein